MQHISINGIFCQHLSIMDRGLHYGDGLFETISCVNGKLQFWEEHVDRMRAGAKQLAINDLAIDNFSHDVQNLLDRHNVSSCVVKLILTRGAGERGYRSSSPQKVTRIVLLSDLPQYPDAYTSKGIKTFFCQTPISKNSKLAGIKHLNRLDNVLARNEWQDEYQEGFMLDDSGYVIEGTMSNLFAINDNELYTPLLSTSGVSGIIRDQILSIAKELDIGMHVMNIERKELENMDGIFVCNSVIGIWPVASLSEKSYKVSLLTRKLFKELDRRIKVRERVFYK